MREREMLFWQPGLDETHFKQVNSFRRATGLSYIRLDLKCIEELNVPVFRGQGITEAATQVTAQVYLAYTSTSAERLKKTLGCYI